MKHNFYEYFSEHLPYFYLFFIFLWNYNLYTSEFISNKNDAQI